MRVDFKFSYWFRFQQIIIIAFLFVWIGSSEVILIRFHPWKYQFCNNHFKFRGTIIMVEDFKVEWR